MIENGLQAPSERWLHLGGRCAAGELDGENGDAAVLAPEAPHRAWSWIAHVGLDAPACGLPRQTELGVGALDESRSLRFSRTIEVDKRTRAC